MVVLYWHGVYVCALAGSVPSDAHHFDTALTNQSIQSYDQAVTVRREQRATACAARTGLLNRDAVYLELQPVRRSLGFTVRVAAV